MLQGNAGFQKLVALIEHLGANGTGMTAYEGWRRRRWAGIRAALKDWSQEPQADAFINRYAGSLADSLLDLMLAGAWDVAGEAAVDFLEELFDQTKTYQECVDAAPAAL